MRECIAARHPDGVTGQYIEEWYKSQLKSSLADDWTQATRAALSKKQRKKKGKGGATFTLQAFLRSVPGVMVFQDGKLYFLDSDASGVPVLPDVGGGISATSQSTTSRTTSAVSAQTPTAAAAPAGPGGSGYFLPRGLTDVDVQPAASSGWGPIEAEGNFWDSLPSVTPAAATAEASEWVSKAAKAPKAPPPQQRPAVAAGAARSAPAPRAPTFVPEEDLCMYSLGCTRPYCDKYHWPNTQCHHEQRLGTCERYKGREDRPCKFLHADQARFVREDGSIPLAAFKKVPQGGRTPPFKT